MHVVENTLREWPLHNEHVLIDTASDRVERNDLPILSNAFDDIFGWRWRWGWRWGSDSADSTVAHSDQAKRALWQLVQSLNGPHQANNLPNNHPYIPQRVAQIVGDCCLANI